MDTTFWLLSTRQPHRQPGVLDAERDPFTTQLLETFVVADLAANVTDTFATNILSAAFHIKRIA